MAMDRATTRISDTPDRVMIAANPRAGAGSPGGTVERLASVLRHYQFRVEIFTDLDTVTSAAERAWEAGELRALVAAGGDGTVAELVNRTSVGLPIAVYPLGTANLLAGYLQIRANFQPFARMLQRGATVRLDAGRAAGRIFLLMVGCGFDAEVVHRLHANRGGHISMWSYSKPIFESIRSYQYPELRIRCDSAPIGNGNRESSDSTSFCVSARWAFVVNLPCYAAKLQFAPGAVGTDGQLEVATFRDGGLLNGFRYLGYLWSGTQAWLSELDHKRMQARHIRIESDVPVRYQLDGDPGGILPLDIEVLPNRLTLLAPAERAAALNPTPPELINHA
jgi:diacylglycerol kinase (ATP)